MRLTTDMVGRFVADFSKRGARKRKIFLTTKKRSKKKKFFSEYNEANRLFAPNFEENLNYFSFMFKINYIQIGQFFEILPTRANFVTGHLLSSLPPVAGAPFFMVKHG